MTLKIFKNKTVSLGKNRCQWFFTPFVPGAPRVRLELGAVSHEIPAVCWNPAGGEEAALGQQTRALCLLENGKLGKRFWFVPSTAKD